MRNIYNTYIYLYEEEGDGIINVKFGNWDEKNYIVIVKESLCPN